MLLFTVYLALKNTISFDLRRPTLFLLRSKLKAPPPFVHSQICINIKRNYKIKGSVNAATSGGWKAT